MIANYRIGEQLLIGDDILVEVLEISDEQVRLGVTAPREVKVLRDERLEDEAQPSIQLPLEVAANAEWCLRFRRLRSRITDRI